MIRLRFPVVCLLLAALVNIPLVLAQTPVAVTSITAAASGPTTAALSDGIVCPSDTGCVIGASATLGWTPGSVLSDNSAISAVIKASAGTLAVLVVTNKLSAPMYVRAYDASSANCTSATGIKQRWIIPANTAGSGAAIPLPVQGLAFATGIVLCFTTTVTDTDNTAIATGGAALSWGFK